MRGAVRATLGELGGGSRVIVACSGGPDSLALAGAAAWVAERLGMEASAVVVDHGLQPGSATVAQDAAAACQALGLMHAEVIAVSVGQAGGPEAAAREARYAALEAAAARAQASAVLLGHTLDDQAETVLLRMGRGSGTRSLAAMAEVNGLWRRPLLGLRRSAVHQAAQDLLAPLGLTPWQDPHNTDPAYARSRVRHALAVLSDDLGTGFATGLARTADLARADADALDALAGEAFAATVTCDAVSCTADAAELASMHRALRWRILRAMALRLGAPGDDIDSDQVLRVDSLVTGWHGQGAIHLATGIIAERLYGRLSLHRGSGRHDSRSADLRE